MSPFVTVALLCLFGAAAAQDPSLDRVWESYKAEYKKDYPVAEEPIRRLVWEDNVAYIRSHNLQHDLGKHTFTLGLNEYADLTSAEYEKYLLGARSDLRQQRDSWLEFESRPGLEIPDTVDWRDQGFVTPVKNQGQCGSCWAFSSTGAMEGAHKKKTGQLVSLSEQNLVDCCKKNAGCNGGWMDNSFQYVNQNGGIDTETYYPYQAKETGRCSYNPNDVGAHVASWVDVKKGDEEALQQAVATIGPIAVAIDASKKSFQLYKSGIYFEDTCSHLSTDHAVLVVGYGQYNGYDYWLVKNSWGETWGEQGYLMMARNYNNMCAIASFASYPVDDN